MDTLPYHHYFFFSLDKAFYALTPDAREALTKNFKDFLQRERKTLIVPYATLGFKVDATCMLWCRSASPEENQDLLRDLLRTPFGQHLTLTHNYFGIERPSPYSGRTGKPEQVMQNYDDRLPYLIVYPFTKTHAWYQHSFDERRAIMGEHVKTGLGHEKIRQCLLYSYGLDDYEFLVSYETTALEDFQKLIMDMRSTKGRPYTLSDTPLFTCIYKPLDEFIAWL